MLWWKGLRGFAVAIKMGAVLAMAERKPFDGWPIQRTVLYGLLT